MGAPTPHAALPDPRLDAQLERLRAAVRHPTQAMEATELLDLGVGAARYLAVRVGTTALPHPGDACAADWTLTTVTVTVLDASGMRFVPAGRKWVAAILARLGVPDRAASGCASVSLIVRDEHGNGRPHPRAGSQPGSEAATW